MYICQYKRAISLTFYLVVWCCWVTKLRENKWYRAMGTFALKTGKNLSYSRAIHPQVKSKHNPKINYRMEGIPFDPSKVIVRKRCFGIDPYLRLKSTTIFNIALPFDTALNQVSNCWNPHAQYFKQSYRGMFMLDPVTRVQP